MGRLRLPRCAIACAARRSEVAYRRRPSDIAKLPEGRAKARLQKIEHRKASVRAKGEHPFRVIKRQFSLMKVRFRGLQKNTAHLLTLFALSNLWMARRQLMPEVRLNAA